MFSVMHTDGSGDDSPSLERLPELLDELRSATAEHGDVAVVHEDSGWCLSAHCDGRLVLEHLREGGERHMIPVARERILDLWRRLAVGDIESILQEPWRPGYVEPPLP
jgi:hypothetical protein